MTSRTGLTRRSLLVGAGLATLAACNSLDGEELARFQAVEQENLRLRATMAALAEPVIPGAPAPVPQATPPPTAVPAPTSTPSPLPTKPPTQSATETPSPTPSPTATPNSLRAEPEPIAGPFGEPIYADRPYSEYLANRVFYTQSAYDFRAGGARSRWVKSVRYSPSQGLLAVEVYSQFSTESELALLEVVDRELPRPPHARWPGATNPIAWSNGGDRIAFAIDLHSQISANANYVVIAGISLDTIVTLDISGTSAADLAWSPDDRSICGLLQEDAVDGQPDEDVLHVRTWNPASGQVESDVEIRDAKRFWGGQVHWKRSGDILAVIKRDQDIRLDVAVLRLASPTGPAEYVYSVPGLPGLGYDFFLPRRRLSFSPDEQFFAYVAPSILRRSLVWIVKTDDGTIVGPTGSDNPGYPVAWSPFGERIAAVGGSGADEYVVVSDRRENQLVSGLHRLPTLKHDAAVNDLAWIDADTLAIGDQSGLVAIWRSFERD